jgi:hypothetical protein
MLFLVFPAVDRTCHRSTYLTACSADTKSYLGMASRSGPYIYHDGTSALRSASAEDVLSATVDATVSLSGTWNRDDEFG